MASELSPAWLNRCALEDKVALQFMSCHGINRRDAMKLADALSAQIPNSIFEAPSYTPQDVTIAHDTASPENIDAYIITLTTNGSAFSHRVALPLAV
jgi:hypothetical protein